MNDVDLANMALDMVGQSNIASLQDGTKVAAIVNRHLYPTVREVLRDGKWKSARKSQVQLSLLASSPGLKGQAVGQNNTVYPQVGGWPPGATLPVYDGGIGFASPFADDVPFNWWFQLPADWLRIVMFNQTDPLIMTDPLFEINGNVLLTTNNVAEIDYVCDVTQNPSGPGYGINMLDPKLQEAIYTKLAVKFAWRFQQSMSEREALKKEAEMALRRAAAIDSRDERQVLSNAAADSDWLKNRFVSTNA